MVTFDPFDRAWWSDPYPVYRELRDDAPFGRINGLPLWYFTRFADCDAVLRDHRFSNDQRLSTLYQQFASEDRRPGGRVDRMRSFLFLDPPDHTRLRGLVHRAFTPRVVDGLRPRIEALVDERLDAVDGLRSWDAVAELAYPLPVAVICDLLGVPLEDRDRFRGWSRHLAEALDPDLLTPPDVVQQRVEAIEQFADYFTGLIGERRDHPVDDLLSALVSACPRDQADPGPDGLTHDELLATLILLLVAGFETTVNLIGNAILALGRHPDQRDLVAAQPQRVADAVEEVLRWDPPVQIISKIAAHDIDVGSHSVKAGEVVLLLIGAANRDEEQTPSAEEFDVRRPVVRHLSFSFGPHHCLGAPLARAEAQLALTGLLARYPDLRLTGEPEYRETLVLRGLTSLPVGPT